MRGEVNSYQDLAFDPHYDEEPMKLSDFDVVQYRADVSHILVKMDVVTLCNINITHEPAQWRHYDTTVVDCAECREIANEMIEESKHQKIPVGPASVLETANRIDNMLMGGE